MREYGVEVIQIPLGDDLNPPDYRSPRAASRDPQTLTPC